MSFLEENKDLSKCNEVARNRIENLERELTNLKIQLSKQQNYTSYTNEQTTTTPQGNRAWCKETPKQTQNASPGGNNISIPNIQPVTG